MRHATGGREAWEALQAGAGIIGSWAQAMECATTSSNIDARATSGRRAAVQTSSECRGRR